MRIIRLAAVILAASALQVACDPKPIELPPSWDGIVINEAYSQGKGAANPDELDWVELYNSSDKSVDVGGLVLTDKQDMTEKVTIAEGTTIAAKGYLVVDVDIVDGFGLSSGGDQVWLFDPEGTQLDHVVFGAMRKEESWSAFPDGSGEFRLQSVTKGASNDSGEVIPPVVVADYTGLVINEAYSRGKGGANPEELDWVELYNGSDESIDLGGVVLTDKQDMIEKVTLDQGTTIAAKGYLVIDVDIVDGFGLSSGGDQVWLFDPEGTQLDHVEFGAMREEESWSAFPDGSDEFRMQSVTKGASNDTGEVIPPIVIADYTGLVINEVDGNGKFVELHNTSGAAISLSGVYLVKNEDKTWWTGGSEATIAAGGFYAIGTNGDKDLDPAVTEGSGGSGISPKQIVKFSLNTPDENEIDSFERSREGMVWGDGCLPDYGKSDPKYSFSRCPDGTGNFGLAVPSCNAANPATAAGPIITEPVE